MLFLGVPGFAGMTVTCLTEQHYTCAVVATNYRNALYFAKGATTVLGDEGKQSSRF